MLEQNTAQAMPLSSATTLDGDNSSVIAIPIMLGQGLQGIALIDKTHYTISIYQYRGLRYGKGGLVLLAVRSYKYDCQLENFNTAKPFPSEVKQLLLGGNASKQPAPLIPPKNNTQKKESTIQNGVK